VSATSSPAPYLFGDLLALARENWVAEMSRRLEARGYSGYRRSDAAAMRLLRGGPIPIGRAAQLLGVTRQAARKGVAALEQRGYARTERDPADARRLNVVLSAAGRAYADAVVEVLGALNRELGERVEREQLIAADAVLRASFASAAARERAATLVAPPA